VDKLLKEKLALIFEYNKKSPLFIYAADIEISKNNLQGAKQLIEEGLKIFPDYPTALILLGKVLMLRGEMKEAENVFSRVAQLINNKSTLDHYLKEIDNQRADNVHFTPSRRASFASDELNKLLGKNTGDKENIIPEVNDNFYPEVREFEDNLDDLAKKISAVKIIIDDNKPIPEKINSALNEDNEIISETMAMIYLSQKKMNEAIDIYEKLKIKYPSNVQDYQKRIDDIRKKISLVN